MEFYLHQFLCLNFPVWRISWICSLSKEKLGRQFDWKMHLFHLELIENTVVCWKAYQRLCCKFSVSSFSRCHMFFLNFIFYRFTVQLKLNGITKLTFKSQSAFLVIFSWQWSILLNNAYYVELIFFFSII